MRLRLIVVTLMAPLSSNIVCSFADRASLGRALRAYADRHPQLRGATLTRIGD